MTEEVRRYLARAGRALDAADALARAGFTAEAASRTYYAMFYAAQALLKSDGIEVTKHSAVESQIGYRYAKTGAIAPKYHRMLINARNIREKVDYDLYEEIVEPSVTLTIEQGRDFVKMIHDRLSKGES